MEDGIIFHGGKKSLKKKSFFVVNGLKEGYAWFAWLLLLPAISNFLIFWCIPNASSFYYAFTNDFGEWSLGNFRWVVSEMIHTGGVFNEALKNTLAFFSLGYFGTQTFNIILAYFFYKKIAGYRVFRAILWFPSLLIGSVFTTVFIEMLSPMGPIMPVLKDWGLIEKIPQLLNQTSTAMKASLAYSAWMCVGGVLYYCTGAMARIPKELLEAAELDGITPLKELIFIIIPMISGTLSTLYVIGLAGILTAGGATLYLTNGKYGTMTISYWLFTQVRDGGSVGTSSALGLMLTAVVTPIVFAGKWFIKKFIPEVSY